MALHNTGAHVARKPSRSKMAMRRAPLRPGHGAPMSNRNLQVMSAGLWLRTQRPRPPSVLATPTSDRGAARVIGLPLPKRARVPIVQSLVCTLRTLLHVGRTLHGTGTTCLGAESSVCAGRADQSCNILRCDREHAASSDRGSMRNTVAHMRRATCRFARETYGVRVASDIMQIPPRNTSWIATPRV